MPVLRRQYSIDDHLSRFPKALRHLCELSAFDEVKSYAVKHSLYSEALEFYRYQEEKLKEIMRLYADYLQTNGDFKDAGIGLFALDSPCAPSADRLQPTNSSTTTPQLANHSVKPTSGKSLFPALLSSLCPNPNSIPLRTPSPKPSSNPKTISQQQQCTSITSLTWPQQLVSSAKAISLPTLFALSAFTNDPIYLTQSSMWDWWKEWRR